LKVREKNEVKKLVNLDNKQPFVYVSGKFDSQFHKATIAFPFTSGRNGNVIVYDLRHDPALFVDLPIKELEKKFYANWEERQKEGFIALPVKEMQYNRAPAIAPLGVLAQNDGWARIGLDEETITKHRNALLAAPAFAENIRSMYEKRPEYAKATDPEAQLYDGFVPDIDTLRIEKVRQADQQALADLHPGFTDERLNDLLLHYKARSFPRSLAEDEVVLWEKWRAARIHRQLPGFVKRLQELSKTANDDQQFILQELQLWAESIVPLDED
jgi:exodeoxyribonuclease-1